MTHKNPNSRCKALARAANPAEPLLTERGLCFFHATPDKASELGWGAITTGKNLGAILGLLPACPSLGHYRRLAQSCRHFVGRNLGSRAPLLRSRFPPIYKADMLPHQQMTFKSLEATCNVLYLPSP